MTGGSVDEIVAAYRRHRSRSARAWLIALVGPRRLAERVLGATGARARVIRTALQGRRSSEDRERLLEREEIVAFVADDPAEWASLRASSPDLTTALDALYELEAGTSDQRWDVVRAALGSASRRETRAIDLGGLADRPLEVSALYVDRWSDPAADGSSADGSGSSAGGVPSSAGGVPSSAGGVRSTADGGWSSPPGPRRARAWAAGPERRWLLLADAGEGKTTFLRWLDQARPPGLVGSLTPVWLPLAEYGRDAARAVRPIATFLADRYERRGVPGAKLLRDHLGDLLILADGLDEIPVAAVRRSVVQELRSRVFGGVVLTGRRSVVDDVHGAWTPVLGAPFDAGRRGELLRRLAEAGGLVGGVGRVGDGGGPGSGAGLEERLRSDPALDRVVSTPLLAVLAATAGGRVPPPREIELYASAAARLVEGTGRKDALRVLGPLAWRVAESGGAALEEPQLQLRPGELEVLRRALVHTPAGWMFPHPTIAQHLAAVEATRSADAWARLLEAPFAPHRSPVVVFLAAHLDTVRRDHARRDDLVRAVLRRSRRAGRYGAVHPELVGQLLVQVEELGSVLFTELARRWCDLVFKAAYRPLVNEVVEAAAVDLLDRLRHHPRAELFGKVLRERRHAIDWTRRRKEVLEPALDRWF